MNASRDFATGVTLLWALRSPCNLNCQYCYFGTLEEARRRQNNRKLGELTHAPDNDISYDSIANFISSLNPGCVKRVFIAGGEPLQWQPILDVIRLLKAKGCEVIICTNGLALADFATTKAIVQAQVDAVSVSLDSFDAQYNDGLRRDPHGVGFRGVVAGISQFTKHRDAQKSGSKVGVYTVVTKENISHVASTARFVASLGVDYYIYQPISLSGEHDLYSRLALNKENEQEMRDIARELANSELRLALPNRRYLEILPTSICNNRRTVRSCFGGRDLFFIQPDGTVWDCPSCHKIAADAATNNFSVLTHSALELFGKDRRGRKTDCAHFSVDCVNMWQLMAFDEILRPHEREIKDLPMPA